MPTLSLTDAVDATTAYASLINNNNTAIKNLLNGGLDNTNVTAAAAIAVSKLAAGSNGDVLTTTGGVPVWGAAAATNPPGVILPYVAATAPTGYLLCDGTEVSRTTYAALFAIIGTVYGSAGGTTFTLPDLRGRVPVGYAASGGHADVSTLAGSEGVAIGSRRPKHITSISDPGHSHNYNQIVGNPANIQSGSNFTGLTSATSSSTTGITAGVASTAPTDTPAYLIVNYIIKT